MANILESNRDEERSYAGRPLKERGEKLGLTRGLSRPPGEPSVKERGGNKRRAKHPNKA